MDEYRMSFRQMKKKWPGRERKIPALNKKLSWLHISLLVELCKLKDKLRDKDIYSFTLVKIGEISDILIPTVKKCLEFRDMKEKVVLKITVYPEGRNKKETYEIKFIEIVRLFDRFISLLQYDSHVQNDKTVKKMLATMRGELVRPFINHNLTKIHYGVDKREDQVTLNIRGSSKSPLSIHVADQYFSTAIVIPVFNGNVKGSIIMQKMIQGNNYMDRNKYEWSKGRRFANAVRRELSEELQRIRAAMDANIGNGIGIRLFHNQKVFEAKFVLEREERLFGNFGQICPSRQRRAKKANPTNNAYSIKHCRYCEFLTYIAASVRQILTFIFDSVKRLINYLFVPITPYN